MEGLLRRPRPEASAPEEPELRACGLGAKLEDEGEESGHPEEGFEGVHGEVAIDGEVDGEDEDAGEGECLGGTTSTEGPAEHSGEKDAGGAGEGGEETDAEERLAEEQETEAGLEGHDGAVVDVAPGEMAAAGDVVELVAEVAVTEVDLPEGGGHVEGELEGGEEEGEADGGTQGRVRGADDGGGHGGMIRGEGSYGSFVSGTLKPASLAGAGGQRGSLGVSQKPWQRLKAASLHL